MTLTYPELTRICRGFAMLLHSGVGLADGAFLLAREEQGPLAELLTALGTALDGGIPLSDALEESGAVPEHAWALVRVGETTGHLEGVLESLADYYETRSAVKQQLRQAVAYPALVLALMLVVLGVLLVKVLPIFEKVYASLGRSLTGAAAGLLHTGQILEALLPVLFGVLILMSVGAAVLYFCPKCRRKLVSFWQRRYADRGIGRKFSNAHFAQALSMGLAAGLPLDQCLELAKGLLHSIPGAAERCTLCAQALEEGISFTDAVEKADLLPPSQRRLLSVGIKSGNADRVLGKIAENLMAEAWSALDSAISAVEPALVLVSSGLVGLILLSVMLPLADILSVLG